MKSMLRVISLQIAFALFLTTLLFSALPAQAQPAAQTLTETPVPARWNGQTPFTMLVAGIDRRPGENKTLTVRTDAIMLVRIDPVAKHIGVLHIPRDLFFALPPTENGDPLPLVRVNTLLLRGEEMQAGYGPYYMMDTMQYNFGMYIDSYVLFDFQAFITIVDTLGGIDITTTYNIYDPTYPSMNYGYDPFYLPAGDHHLDGETALKFARTRHGDNDYLRGFRQLQVIRAIGRRAAAPENLPTLLTKAPELLDSLRDEVYTDLTPADAVALGLYAAALPEEQITTGSVNEAYIVHTINEGETVAIPDRSKLIQLLTEVFGEGYTG